VVRKVRGPSVVRQCAPLRRELPKLILQFVGATLLAALLMQAAVAAEHRRRSADSAPVSAGKQSRNANNQVANPSLAEQNFEYWQGLGRAAGERPLCVHEATEVERRPF
jgi:hypothetical protein